jgi:NADH:ubiquinone oxidoreductase subunit 5 (subunit L)/multisubunit Na+/H+ antiporter MnhA subunit
MVSALIHAATLVCLGCVWLSKLVMITGWPIVAIGVASIGLLSYSIVSVLQHDCKRLIAYSTGYNISGIVLWLTFQVEMALHHMGCHAMFKATIFLC